MYTSFYKFSVQYERLIAYGFKGIHTVNAVYMAAIDYRNTFALMLVCVAANANAVSGKKCTCAFIMRIRRKEILN